MAVCGCWWKELKRLSTRLGCSCGVVRSKDESSVSLTRDCSLRCPEMAMMRLFEIPELDQRVMEVALTQ